MYARHLMPALQDALSDSPVVFLNGARQTGKSTLVQELAADRHPARYVTLDDAGTLGAAKYDPKGFLQGFDGPIIIDEAQRAPELFPALKAEVDRDRRPGRYLLTGSANVLFLPRLADALAGRMEILTLWPLSQGEIEGIKEGFVDALFQADMRLPEIKPSSREHLWRRVALGGYPEPLTRTRLARRQAWAKGYVTAILERDVRDLSNIEGLAQLPRLLDFLAVRMASLMNFAEISRSMGMPQSTLKRYLALLEAAFLARRLPPWSGNLGKRLVKMPKLFLNDTGLGADLLGIEPARLSSNGNLTGPFLECFVVAEIAKQIGWSKVNPRMHHMRMETGREVDLVLEDAQGRCVGIEVKSDATVGVAHFKGLKAFEEALGRRFLRGVVLYTGRETVPFAKNLHAMPVDALWQVR